MRSLRLSVSRLNRYLFCPAQDYYTYHRDVPSRTNYPLLRGKQVHAHIGVLHKPLGSSSKPRPFFFQSRLSAIRQWFWRWGQALEENADYLIRPDDREAKKEGRIGAGCVKVYWDSFYDWPRPLRVEHPYRYPIVPGVELVGTTDQEREVSIPWIKAHRPEIVQDGRLLPDYDPVVLLDLKSNYENYDPYRQQECPQEVTLQDRVVWQLPLHLDFQATIYTWFYHIANRRRPVGFIWWHMSTGTSFFTYRTDDDYEQLNLAVRHVVAGISANSYPRRPGSHCRQCLVYDACWGDRPFLVASTEYFPRDSGSKAFQEAPSLVKRVSHQLPLKLGVRRRKAEELPVIPTERSKTILLGGAPRPELQDIQLELG